MAQIYAAKYLAKAAMSAPRDFVRAAVAKYTPLHPTVFIFHCTFVCDARCEMCSNWTRGNRKEDMTLEQIERVFSSNLWKDIENASISGGEPTTRNDLVDIAARDDRQVPEAAEAHAQHHRHHASPRDPDADQDRRALQRAQRDLLDARVDRRRQRHARLGPQRPQRVRKGRQDHRRDAGAAEDAQASTSASRRRSSRRTSRTPTTSWRGRRRKNSTSSSTWCASPTPCWATPSSRRA